MEGTLPDYLRPRLRVLFVGFNPGERSARIGHHYAGRGNQFWNFLFEAGLTAERLAPEEDHRLLEFDMGLTNVVSRWSKSASELRATDYDAGAPSLIGKIRAQAPAVVAFNGKSAYEGFSGRPARLGWQRRAIEGARVFVLPCTSGRNSTLTRAAKLRYFRQLARWLKRGGARGSVVAEGQSGGRRPQNEAAKSRNMNRIARYGPIRLGALGLRGSVGTCPHPQPS